jgi:hypothetical protein
VPFDELSDPLLALPLELSPVETGFPLEGVVNGSASGAWVGSDSAKKAAVGVQIPVRAVLVIMDWEA